MFRRTPETRALILDLDGVTNWRFPAQKAGVPIIGHHNPDKYTQPVRKVPVFVATDRQGNIFQAFRHMLSPVFPDVIRVLKGLPENVVVFGNTGRHDNKFMTSVTLASFKIAGVDHIFRTIYFKPEDQETVEHKEAVSTEIAEKYGEENTTIVDDNPYDLLPQASHFPRASLVLIKDWTTDKLLKGIDMQTQYPNVVVCRTLREAIGKSNTLRLAYD